jgi:16S rRNA pseudouridine516 synthase
MNAKLRLDRLLANLGYGTRRTVQNIVNAGQVTLDGIVLLKAEQHIPLSADLPERMLVNGQTLDPLPGLCLIMNKPLGYTCSHKEEEGQLVYDLLPERWRLREPALSTIGRLDKETSGLLLFTDDGALLHRLASPKHELPKRYLFTLRQPLGGGEAELFAKGGLMLPEEKKPLRPARLETHSPISGILEISEGRYHQVRRMFAHVGNEVVTLHRLSVGGLSLPEDLKVGEYRRLPEGDLTRLLSIGGSKENIQRTPK